MAPFGAGCRAPAKRARAVDGGSAQPVATAPIAPVPTPTIVRTDPEVVRVVIDVEPQSLNPDLDPDVWAWRIGWDAVYEPLVRPRVEADGGGFEPLLAESFRVEDDGARITMKLRTGVTFHDGSKLTASDVAFTFDRVRSGKTRAPRVQALLSELERVEIAGPQTVRFVWHRPSAYSLVAISEVGILPESVFGKGDLNYASGNRHPVGTGPLKVDSWERGKRILLSRYPGYWGEPARAEKMVVEIQGDAVKAIGRAKHGEVDLLGRVPPAWIPEQLESPSLKALFKPVRVERTRFSFVLWNVTHAPLDNVEVRRALGSALDKKRLLAEARHGLGRPLAAVPASAELAVPAGDPIGAQAAIDRLLPRGPAGRLRGGRRFQLLVPTGSREAEAAGKRVEAALVKLGLSVELLTGDLGILMLRIKKGMFDAALLEWAGGDDEDLGPLFKSHAQHNYGNFSSHEVDRLIEALRQPPGNEGERAERPGLRKRLAEQLAREAPALFLYAPDDMYLYARRLRQPRRAGDFVLLRDVGPE